MSESVRSESAMSGCATPKSAISESTMPEEQIQWQDMPHSSSQGFRGGQDPRPNDKFIAVMGVTGSGKSSFISACSGKTVPIGHDLNSCTSIVDTYSFDLSPKCTVYLIDTPGFDDTTKSDTEVLREIAAWLGDSYQNKILLHGIIYLHRITDVRMQGSSKKNLLMFRQLCGQDALKKVILATTMWDKVPVREALAREKELVNTQEFWGWMLEKGSSCHRHNNTTESAKRIVNLLADHNAPTAVDLQRQLVDERRTLDETSAGRELQGELLKEREKWAQERREIEEHIKAAIRERDRETEQIMREERDRYTRMIKAAEGNTDALRSSMENLIAQRDKRVARIEQQIKEQKASYENDMRQLKIKQDELERENGVFTKGMAKERLSLPLRTPQRDPEPDFRPHPKHDHSRDYSVTMSGEGFTCVSEEGWCSTSGQWAELKGSMSVRAASHVENHDGESVWIARFSDGSWHKSKDLHKQYPHLDAKISSYGLQNLEICFLGPMKTYYARWQNGHWSCFGIEKIRAIIRDPNTCKNRNRIHAAAFGHDDSYVISYGKGTSGMSNLKNSVDLNGCYPRLQSLLDRQGAISIIAVALNVQNSKDFVIVWTPYGGDGDLRAHWYSSYPEVSRKIEAWWDATCEE